MLRYMLLLVTALFMVGCVPGSNFMKVSKEKKYREFDNYNVEITPLLETGYAVIREDKIHQRRNITPEQFSAKVGAIGYKGSEFVMVDTDIADGYYNFHAVYLKKINVNRMVLGATLQSNMPMHIREEFGTNKGCALGKIYYNTPAYKYDLHENDIVTYVNDVEVSSCKHLKKLLDKHSIVNFKVWADGEIIEVNHIVLNK